MSRITADNISSRSGGSISINNGVIVGSAVTVNSTGINVTGIVTATSFSITNSFGSTLNLPSVGRVYFSSNS